ncbi:MAG: methyl-accepting chemotaxis protein [Coleofasciculaceae cyanobacterium]
MSQTPPNNSSDQTTDNLNWTANGAPVEGQSPGIDESLPYGSLLSSQEIEKIKNNFSTHQGKGKVPWWNFTKLDSLSLRVKATMLALAIGTIPVAIVGSSAYFASSQGIKEQIIQNEQTNAEDLEDKLNIFMQQRYRDVVGLSKLESLSNSKIREALTDEEKNQILEDYLQSSQVYNSIAAFDPIEKEVLGFAGGNFNIETIVERDYSVKVEETDSPAIVDPRVAGGNNEFSLFSAAPIKDQETDETIGVIRTRTPMTLVNDLFGVDPKRSQEFYLTDSGGQITASSDPEALQKQLEEIFPKLSSQIEKKSEQGLTEIVTENGKEQIFTYIPNQELGKNYNLSWGLLLARPTNVAFAPQRQLFLTLLVGTIILALLVAALAVIIANRVTRPILTATEAVEKIGRGQLDTRLPIQGQDELALLGSNINSMAAQIKTLLKEQALATEEQRRLKDEQQQITEGLQSRVLELLEEVEPISEGDLTIRAKVTSDDIGTIADSYNFMVGNLREIVAKVQKAAGNVAETTRKNETSVQSLSVEALRQAEEIGQALKQVQEMAKSVRLVAANAEKAATVVQQANQTVEEGDAAMNRTVNGILAIRETVAGTRQKVKYLGESSQKISTVVNLISSFAAQTKLLAFNASIEAARAGEEGRGFAVVADEVRTLAQQSAEASTEIEQLVAAIQGETNEVIAAMEAGTEQVVTGTRLVEETRHSLNKISAASTEISQLVAAITQATIQQSETSETVTKTMNHVTEISSRTSQEVSLVSSSFEELQKVAQALQEDVGQFKIS